MKFPVLYDLLCRVRGLSRRDLLCRRMKIRNRGRYVKLQKEIKGQNNSMEIGPGAMIHGLKIHITGNNNRLVIGADCVIGPNCSFWFEGNGGQITIGAGSTFTHSVHFCVQEEQMSITVGEDCMFSNQIVVRTSDSHPIYDLAHGERINPPREVWIGRHVWIAPGSRIMKGAKIGDGAVIGSETMVNKEVPANCLAVGTPCKVVKSGIRWTREALF